MLLDIAQYSKSLISLNISNCRNLTNQGLYYLYAGVMPLKSLIVRGIKPLNTKLIENIKEKFTNIEVRL